MNKEREPFSVKTVIKKKRYSLIKPTSTENTNSKKVNSEEAKSNK